eukprot:PhF_6_TR24784/c0_g1_i4/m.34062
MERWGLGLMGHFGVSRTQHHSLQYLCWSLWRGVVYGRSIVDNITSIVTHNSSSFIEGGVIGMDDMSSLSMQLAVVHNSASPHGGVIRMNIAATAFIETLLAYKTTGAGAVVDLSGNVKANVSNLTAIDCSSPPNSDGGGGGVVGISQGTLFVDHLTAFNSCSGSRGGTLYVNHGGYVSVRKEMTVCNSTSIYGDG